MTTRAPGVSERPDAPYEVPADDRALGEPDGKRGPAQLDITKLIIRLTDAPKPLPDPETLTFGTTFTDHMAITSFDPVSGWSAPEIKPYAPLTLDPASCCLHYCGNVFEGMKAYVGQDGKVRLFRPEMNVRRLERSMARLTHPPIDGDGVLELIKRFAQTEKRWIPGLTGYSLYLRPTVIDTRPAISLARCDHATLFIIASPCGPLFPRPVSLLADIDAVRAWPGGTGGDKYGGNYAPGFLPQCEATARGYDQVLWLLGPDRYVTEAGVMNVFVVHDRADGDGWDVITPPLDGTILPGVTRASCLALAADPAFHERATKRLHPAERAFTMHDLVRWAKEGTLRELFCVGTAVIVVAVERIGFEGRDVCPLGYPGDERGLGPVGRALRDMILAVQQGTEEYDGWGVVCEA